MRTLRFTLTLPDGLTMDDVRAAFHDLEEAVAQARGDALAAAAQQPAPPLTGPPLTWTALARALLTAARAWLTTDVRS